MHKRIRNRAPGTEPLRNLIDIVGGWPMLPNWSESSWDLERSIMKLREHGGGKSVGNIFRQVQLAQRSEKFETKPNDSQQRDYRVLANAFRSYLIDIAVIVGAERAVVESQIDDAIVFEQELINLNSRREGEALSIKNLTKRQSEVDVKLALTQWLDVFHPSPLVHFTLRNNEEKKLGSSDSLAAFEELWEKTSKRTLANFFVIRVIGFSSQFMTRAMKERALHYRMELFGVKQKEEGWKQCVDVVSSKLQLAVEAMFAREYFDLQSKATAIEIAHGVIAVFVELLASISWLLTAAKAKIQFRIDEVVAKLQFPKELLSDRQVDFVYRKLLPETENLFETALQLTIFQADRKFLLMQTGINLKSGDAGSAGVLNSVDVKDFNKIRTSFSSFMRLG